ncbi:uncharacterized protein EAF01_004300 [Botrytis porri]|uniref:Uncharacterized protein n=1 Tax=Botrytis porri TaxID=87229 RepID=A0A4Z1KWA3_9HELO|nr:uncharacterized protein EAF01_004300 [Botrytis porri]KAF7908545.1 hypothetical protein EAF01_004300 [Botrytis porri]TGO88797.1 hypothetical protein BPOR_0141g00080 [Botrytis porri]
MASSSVQDSWLNSNITTPTPTAFDDHEIPRSISPLSLSHNFYPPAAPQRSPPYPSPKLAPDLKRSRSKDSKYSKKEMVYRAIDDKIDLVRFLQAYESILAAFGVKTREVNDEREKEKLDVAERIVYRLFWNDLKYAGSRGSESVPLTHVKAKNQVVDTGTSASRLLRVTPSEVDAINAIVDEAYEGLRMATGPVIENILNKGKVTSTITEVREVGDAADEIDPLVNANAKSMNRIVEDDLGVAAGPQTNISAEKSQITSEVTEVVEAPIEIDLPLVGFLKDGSLDEEPTVFANHVANIIDEKNSIFSTITEVAEAPRSFRLAIRSKSTSDLTDPPTVISIKSEADISIETLYEQYMKSPEILLLGRWGRERYNEWKREIAKAQNEIAKEEIFRLMELKQQLLPLESGKQPYTYGFTTFTQNHIDSSALQLWSFNPVERTEELLGVKLLWRYEAFILKSITVEPLSLDDLAADETKGRRALENAYKFLGFWDWSARSPCKEGAKAKPMHQICLQWLDPNNVFRKAHFQKRSVSNTSEKIKRNREGSGSKDVRSWREKRTVSGANYIGGKKRCVSGSWYGGKKRKITGNSDIERKYGMKENLSQGRRIAGKKTAIEIWDAREHC